MFQLTKRELGVLTVEKARECLAHNTYPQQRQIRYAKVNEYVTKILTGKFRTGEVAFTLIDGETILMNGQHQSSAVIEAGKGVDCLFEYFECETAKDVADLFRQFDNLQRSLVDYLSSEAGALKLNWRKTIISLVSSAAIMLTQDNVKPQGYAGSVSTKTLPVTGAITKEVRAQILSKFIPEGNFVQRIYEEGTMETFRHLNRSIIVWAIIKTFWVNPDDAYLFWSDIRDGYNLGKDSPQLKLRDFLKNVVGRGAIKSSNNKEIAHKCITAWNSFRKNKKTTLKYSESYNIPEAI